MQTRFDVFPWAIACLAPIAVFGLLGCSKDNTVNVDNTPAPPGSAEIGSACAASEECSTALCLAGFCRQPCKSSNECGASKICLYEPDAKASGCSLPDEQTCTPADGCSTKAFSCAVDSRCRTPCSGSCTQQGSYCVDGACFGSDETEGVAPGVVRCAEQGKTGLFCDAHKLVSCNAPGKPGWNELAQCASTEECAFSASQQSSTCISKVCEPQETRCFDGAAELCKSNGSGWSSDDCAGQNKQCNPTTAECITLAIDPYEVDRTAYAAFLADGSKPSTPGCSWKNDFTPDDWTGQQANPSLPVVGVDWCDAFTYCAWKGKHLCGKIGGGMAAYASHTDPGLGEWMNACSSGGDLTFPYGALYETQKCNDGAMSKSGAVEGLFAGNASQISGCRSPRKAYSGTINLLGNVAEWENACEKDASSSSSGAGASDKCRARGGAFDTPSGDMAKGCAYTPADSPRDHRSPNLGFRCRG